MSSTTTSPTTIAATTVGNPSNNVAASLSTSTTTKKKMTKQQQDAHEAFKQRLVEDVFGDTGNSSDKVPMEKVVMLIWQFRDDPSVVTFMARFMAKYAGVRHVLDGIEFYLPQLAHMIIHLEVEWDDEILERFALVIAQQSIHFALQLNWILQGALQDYQPERNDGTPNPTYHPKYYTRCLKLLRNVEGSVVYGRPRSQELQRLYINGQINKQEMEQLEHADRRFNALQITTQNNEEFYQSFLEGEIQNIFYVQMPAIQSEKSSHDTKKKKSSSGSNNDNVISTYVQRFCVLERHVLNFYIINLSSCGGGSSTSNSTNGRSNVPSNYKLDRAISLEHVKVHAGLPEGEQPSQSGSTFQQQALMIRIVRTNIGDEFRIRCSTPEEHKLWLRRLGEEAQGSTLFRIDDANNQLTQDLSPAQLDRYNLFNNERLYIQALTDIAETLRFQDRDQRKINAPKLIAEMKIAETIYLPLCNSSDIWRRVIAPIPNETRVFNTKARCPVIMYFLSKRGERIKRGIKCDPNLDIAEFLHLYFDVPEQIIEEEEVNNPSTESDPVGETNIEIESNDKKSVTIKVKDEHMKNSEHNSVVWTSEDHEDDDDDDDDAAAPGTRNQNIRGNKKVQRLLRESVVTIPSKLSKRLQQNKSRRVISVMDRQTQMQPMVQIIEGRNEDADNASIGDGTVVSIERSSILVQDRILFGDLDEGKIDLQSIDRAKQHVSNGESWAEKSARMLEAATLAEQSSNSNNNNSNDVQNGPSSPTSITSTNNEQLEIASCMAKSNDDLRQEVFVMQMIHYYKSVFAQAKLPLWLKTYRILSTSNSTGLIEVLVDATSLDGLKKSKNYPTKEEGGLRKYFETVYDGPNSDAFKAAQTNFMYSLAAYALVSYFLGLKDRHNGNIMIDTRGHLIFIDFGFAFGMAPGHEFSMERAPFKLTKEYIDVMGGTRSECYKEFERLFVAGFEECRRNSQIALGLVEIMMYQSNYPCFSGSRYGNGIALTKFEQRLMLQVPDHRIKRKALRLIRKSRQHIGTYLYDAFQKATNGYAI